MTREGLALAAVLTLAGACDPSPAREPVMAQNQTTIMRVEPREQTEIAVSTRSRTPDGRLADPHSAYHDNISPPLSWTRVPGARAYALIVEDPDAPREQPFVHWLAWNIPGEAASLPEGIANVAHPVSPQGLTQGKNDAGSYGWFGPRPPAGHGVHRYYFQLFALDAPLELGAGTPLEELVGALKAHTIAEGQMMATYEAPTAQ